MREKRPKLPIPRRRLALLWLLAPCLLLLVSHLTGIYCLTPDRAQRKMEETYLLGPTETVWSSHVEMSEYGVPMLLRLGGNEDTVFLSEYRFDWRSAGWNEYSTSGYNRMTRRHDGFLTAGLYDRSRELAPEEVDPADRDAYDLHRHRGFMREHTYCVFGCLESPEAAEIQVTFEAADNSLLGPVAPQTVRLTAADWIVGAGGTRYFLCVLDPVRGVVEKTLGVTALDAGGNVLEQVWMP